MVDCIADGRAILFVGAGLSCAAGYPNWDQLLDELLALTCNTGIPADEETRIRGLQDKLIRADEYGSILGNHRLNEEVCKLIRGVRPQLQDVHRDIVRVPFRHVITTNYDDVLSTAHEAILEGQPQLHNAFRGSEADGFLDAIGHPQSGRRYLHLHGHHSDPESLVLGKRSFQTAYGHPGFASRILRTVSPIYRLVFVGYELSDPAFVHLMTHLKSEQHAASARHFAILPHHPRDPPQSSLATEYRENCNTSIVFYDNSSGDFSQFPTVIRQISTRVNLRAEEVAGRANRDRRPGLGASRSAIRLSAPPDRTPEAVTAEPSESTADAHSALDIAIETVFAGVEAGDSSGSIRAYEKLFEQHQEKLSPNQRRRILANMATAFYSRGEVASAITHLHRAYEAYPDSQSAKEHLAFAKFLEGDESGTAEVCREVLSVDPASTRATNLLVRCLEPTLSISQVESEVRDSSVLQSAEVLAALADCSAIRNEWAIAENYARLAVAAAPDWPNALLCLSTVVLQRIALVDQIQPAELAALDEVLCLTRDSERLTKAPDRQGIRADFLANAAWCHHLRNEFELAVDCLRQAVLLSQGKIRYSMQLAMAATQPDDLRLAAANLSSELAAHTGDLEFIRALAYAWIRTDSVNDLQSAESILKSALESTKDTGLDGICVDLVRLLALVYERSKSGSENHDIVRRYAEQSASAAIRYELLSRASTLAGRLDEAREYARRLVSELLSGGTKEDVFAAEPQLRRLGLHAEAVLLIQPYIPNDYRSRHVPLLIAHAFDDGDYQTTIEACEAIRETSLYTHQCAELHYEALVSVREFERARAIAKSLVEEAPNDRLHYLRLSLHDLARTHGLPADFDVNRLPDLGNLSIPTLGFHVSRVLRHAPRPSQYLEAVYQYFRRFPNSIPAIRALVTFVFDPAGPKLELEAPATLSWGTAGLLHPQDGGDRQWVYLESGPDPSVHMSEYGPGHALASDLLGLRRGDRINTPFGTCVVVDIRRAGVARANELASKYPTIDPEETFVRPIRLPKVDDESLPPRERLGELYAELERHSTVIQSAEQAYQQQRMPISWLAARVNKSVFETCEYVASSVELPVFANDYSAESWARAETSLRTAECLVFDSTSLFINHRLGRLDTYTKSGATLVVPRSVYDEIEQSLSESKRPSNSRGTISIIDGNFYMMHADAKAEANRVHSLSGLLSWVEENCEIVGGQASAELKSDKADFLQDTLGVSALDAIAIAKARGGILLCDDWGMRMLAEEIADFSDSIWTQVAVEFFDPRTQPLGEDRCRFMAQLLEINYVGCRVHTTDVALVLRESRWNPDSPSALALRRTIASTPLTTAGRLPFVFLAIATVWVTTPSPAVGRSFVAWLLDGFERGMAGAIARAVYRHHVLDPWLPTRQAKSLKLALRSWRSGDGWFTPSKSRPPTTR